MPNVYIESLGCARNQVDSEIMAARLAAAGWTVAQEPEDADAIVVNTCSFIESATDESIDTILALADHKTNGRCTRLIVAGCLPERYREETARALPEVDLFLGTGAYDRIVDAVISGTGGACLLPDPDLIDVRTPEGRAPALPHAAYLKVAEGCSRHCTFCIIPTLRGRQKSRAMGAIIEEARQLIAGGVREITLVAQETTAYGQDLQPAQSLAALMASLARLDDTVWIRFLYGHPQSVDDALLSVMQAHANICPYFDIPIQHASDAVLRRMGRSTSVESMRQLFESIRSKMPHAVLRTTVLVGFPGETEADVDRLAAFMQAVQFDHLGVFAYSDADDLASHKLADHVPAGVAQARLDRLMALQRTISEARLTRYFGKTLPVLVETCDEPGLYVGRSMDQAPEVDGSVLIRTAAPLTPGSRVSATIVETHEYDLIAHLQETR